MNNYEAKEKIVLAGESKVFKNWQQLLPNITEDMFLESLRWVCEDPAKDGEKLTREIGLTKIGIVKLIRHNSSSGLVTIRHESGKLWSGDCFRVPCDNSDYADADGTIVQTFKLSISARDRI